MTPVLLSLLLAAVAPPPAVVFAGDLPRGASLTAADLEKLGPVDQGQDNPEPTARVTGVPLLKVLRSLGYEDGPKGPQTPKAEKHSGYRKVVVVTASDGYQSVFTCAEIDENLGPTQALLVYKQAGRPLGTDLGPFRMVVPTDKGASRAIYNVTRVDVVDLRRVLPRP